MPFTNSNDFTTGRAQPVTPAGAELCSMRFSLALPVGDLALNNAGYIGILPARCIPVAVLVDGTDMDSGVAAMVLSVGILNAAGTALSTAAADGGAAWGATVATNTAFQQQVLGQPMAAVAASDVDRRMGIAVTAAPTAAVAGTLGLTLIYRSA
jgi:hypothetical protein